jgi:hypothetical protein
LEVYVGLRVNMREAHRLVDDVVTGNTTNFNQRVSEVYFQHNHDCLEDANSMAIACSVDQASYPRMAKANVWYERTPWTGVAHCQLESFRSLEMQI